MFRGDYFQDSAVFYISFCEQFQKCKSCCGQQKYFIILVPVFLLLISQAAGELPRWRWKYRVDVGYLLQKAAPC